MPVYDHMPMSESGNKIYQMELNLKKAETIHLNLVSPNDQVEMEVKASDQKHTWYSKDGYLDLKPKDKGYQKKGIYTITLKGPQLVEYELMYSTAQTVKKLEKNVLEYSSVCQKCQKYFSITFERLIKHLEVDYFLTSEDDQMDNSKTLLKAYISDEPYQLHDKIQTQQREIFFSDGKSVLEKDAIKSLCYNEKKYLCTLYITVQNVGDDSNPIKFGLQVTIDQSIVKIMDGVEAKFAFSEIDDKKKSFYYIPVIKNTDAKKLYVSVGSMLGVMTNVTVRLFENGQNFIHKWSQLKNLKTTTILSTDRQSHSIELSTKLVKKYENPLIIISIITSKKYDQSDNQLAPYLAQQITQLNDFCYIIVESNVVQLMTNRHTQFNLKKNEIRYFEYNLRRVLAENSSIVISLSEFYGHGMLMISENNDTFHKIPSDYNDAKWLSYSGNIIINPENIESKIDSHPRLVVGVTSSNGESGKFIIQVMKKSLSRITYNQPQELVIQKNSTRYFSYISYYFGMFQQQSESQSFSIKLSKYFGKGTLTLIKCDTYDEVQCLKAKKKDNIDSLSFNQQENQVVLTQGNKCFGCLFLIKVSASEEIKGSLTVHIAGQPLTIEPNKQITDVLEENEDRFYQMYLPAKEEVSIVVGILSGSIKLYASLDPFNSQQNFTYNGKPNQDNANFLQIKLTAIDFEEEKKTIYSYLNQVDEIYLTIKIVGGNQQSKFSLIVQTSEQFKILSNGIFAPIDLKFNQSVELLYHSQITDEQPIQLFIQNSEDSPSAQSFNKKIDVLNIHQAQPNFLGSINPDKVDSITPIKTVTTKSSLEIFLPQKKGVYVISIQNINPENESLSISAMITNKNLQILPYNFKVSHYLYPQQSQYYEIYAPSKGVIALDIMMCSGFADIYTTQTYDQLMDKNEHSDIKMHNEFFKLIPVTKPGPVFLGLTSLSDNTDDDQNSIEFYELQLYFYKRETEIPQTHFVMSNDAEITYEETKSNKTHHVIIDLPPIKCMNCSKFKIDSAFVDYQMYLGRTQEQLETNGVCVYMMNDENYTMPKKSYQKLVEHMPLVTSEDVEDIRFKFTVPIQDKYYVMAKATITGLIGKNNTQYEHFIVYYDPLEINLNEPEDIEGNIFVSFFHPSLLQIVFWLIVIFGILFILLMIARIINNKRGGEEKQRLMRGERSHLIKVLDSEGQGPTESFQSNKDAYQEDLQNEAKVKEKITEKYSQFYQPETIIE